MWGNLKDTTRSQQLATRQQILCDPSSARSQKGLCGRPHRDGRWVWLRVFGISAGEEEEVLEMKGGGGNTTACPHNSVPAPNAAGLYTWALLRG